MSLDSNDYAALSKDSYKDRTKEKDEDRIVSIGKYKYKILDTDSDPFTGYQGTAYQKLDVNGHFTGEVIIAHRGTEFGREPIKDGLTDFGMVVTGLNAQAPAAEAFTERAIAKAKIAAEKAHAPLHITVTGHSLGGTLAELTAYKFHLHGETFNAYGVAGLMHGVPEGGSQVINHVRATDVVSAASAHFGEVRVYATTQDIDRLSHAHYHEDGAGLGRNVIHAIDPGAHGIDNFVPDAQGHSALDAENTARYGAHHAMVDRFRQDVLTARTVISARWEVQKFAYEASQAVTVAAAARWLETFETARDTTVKTAHVVGEAFDNAHDAMARSTKAMNDSMAYLSQSLSDAGSRLESKSTTPTSRILLDDPSHPSHALFQQSLQGIQQLNNEHGVAPSERDGRFAGALAAAAAANGLSQIDRVALSQDATYAFAVCKEGEQDLWGVKPWIARVETATALNTPLVLSSEACMRAMQQRTDESAREHMPARRHEQTQEHTKHIHQ
ncbi:XVIPCD domain-containing protein [Dyella acidisoli]|uniref:X-Tfes XVIPCD domain-containing protein n=1 Tax=Dyella acidisoli TaxID=1867834 RepID=A0ABQ5XMW9_9GAMM|nr:XVIPCD domain-containing protein [Dyella acidisoli]GLQ93037.1 hypothetical protein GCM10007901_19880 [Dyella acidisoli]